MADCSSSLVQSDDIYYSGPPLPCIGIEHCDTLTTAIEKIEDAICDILFNINCIVEGVVMEITATTIP